MFVEKKKKEGRILKFKNNSLQIIVIFHFIEF